MNNTKLDVLVLVIAYVTGIILSVISNPLIGIGALFTIIYSWELAPKLLFSKSRELEQN